MKSTFKLTLLATVTAFIFMACADPASEQKPTVDLEKVKTEIQALEDAYAAGESAKDADAVVAYYADDAVSYNRNEEPSVGKVAIRERKAKQIAADTLGNKSAYKVVDLFVEGNKVVEIGSYTQTDSSGKVSDKGFYMSYFENRDGKYQCVRDMSVTTMPAK
jgi:ketosteroid isomerase-like protein